MIYYFLFPNVSLNSKLGLLLLLQLEQFLINPNKITAKIIFSAICQIKFLPKFLLLIFFGKITTISTILYLKQARTLRYLLSRTNSLIPCEFEIERIHYTSILFILIKMTIFLCEI